ncbi:2',5'-phosphodiesterase 12-like [Anthonomus grandis grandis]|uniref:2',5'-phosphodiesterase 12-like n=1 Tax=Anthonomus grandis grandis TaxID=2921223 RepID=UPI00216583B9|nr:2',5'-phosphodiesterase 12-like [Anthonomus grandis grandis]
MYNSDALAVMECENVYIPEQIARNFKCSVCQKYLFVPPVTTNDGTTFRCGRCSFIPTDMNTPVFGFEKLASYLAYPCTFQGCSKVLPWDEISAHEQICRFRIISCPCYSCDESYPINKLMVHFDEKHKKYMCMTQCHIQNRNIKLPNRCLMRLLISHGQPFLMFNYRDDVHFWVSVYCIGPLNKRFNFDITFTSLNGKYSVGINNEAIVPFNESEHCINCLDKECRLKFHKYSQIYQGNERIFDKMTAKIKVDNVVKAVGSDSVNYTVKIVEKVQEDPCMEQESKRDLQLLIFMTNLECQVCKGLMSAPIYNCKIGHTICKECRWKVMKCPQCQKNYSDSRCFALEDIADKIKLECKNKNMGCKFVGNVDQSIEHDKIRFKKMTDQTIIAFIREYESEACDIRVTLTLTSTNGQQITKEIKGYAKLSNTLSDMKKSIKQNIVESFAADKENSCTVNLPKEVTVEFLRGTNTARESILIRSFNNLNEEKSLKILDQTFTIILNAPLVKGLKLPETITAKYPVEPSIFKGYKVYRPASKFLWYKSQDKQTWHKVGEGFSYDVKESDVGHLLKLCCVPYSKFKVKGPVIEAESSNPVEFLPELPRCPFEARHNLTKDVLSKQMFRMVSYNILADRYIDNESFRYCPRSAQGIHYRKQLIIKELAGYNADIICLQEADEPHYESYYHTQLKDLGYRSYFNRKGNCIPEGLVCAFKSKRFRLLEHKHLVLKSTVDRKQFQKVLELLELNSTVKQDFLKQNTSVQTVVLEDTHSGKLLIVGNTHLYYHPDMDHIRLLQAFMATMHLLNLKFKIEKEYRGKEVIVILGGDFNSDFSKSLYGFMIRGTIDPKHSDCLTISPHGDATIFHKFLFTSACGTPKYTNYTEEYKGCLDYIFIEKLKLTVSRVIHVPTEEELEQYVGLPNEVYPSDHLALVVDLKYI